MSRTIIQDGAAVAVFSPATPIAQAAPAANRAAMPWMEELREVVCGFVRLHIGQGIKRAQDCAARALGLTTRRVRAWWQGEIKLVTVQEAGQIKAARQRLYEQHLARLDVERALLRARLANLRETRPDVATHRMALAGAGA